MKAYYLRFNSATQQVDVFDRADNSLIQSVEVINGIVSSIAVEQIAFALDIPLQQQNSFLSLLISPGMYSRTASIFYPVIPSWAPLEGQCLGR